MNFCYYKKEIFLILKIRFLMREKGFLIVENHPNTFLILKMHFQI